MDMATVNSDHNIRSHWYEVASTITACWRCKKPTKVFGIILPASHEVLKSFYVDEDDDGTIPDYDPSINGLRTMKWVVDQTAMTVYFNLKAVANSVLKELDRISDGRYRMDRYSGHEFDTLINHCECCGVRQSEESLNRPKGSATSENYAFAFITHSGPPAPIDVLTVDRPFAAFGSDWIMYGGGCVIIEGSLDE